MTIKGNKSHIFSIRGKANIIGRANICFSAL